MPNFLTTLTRRQEEFSIAWLYAVASAAGFCVQDIRADVDSIDAEIRQQGNRTSFPKLELIQVQLKCTYSRVPKDNQISFPLSKKNYDDLRGKRMIPRILVVLHVPRTLNDWLSHADDSIVLRNCAYWTTLRGKPASSNKKSVNIPIPTSQKLTVQELRKMMNTVAKGKMPEAPL